jgi:hypothetical protein
MTYMNKTEGRFEFMGKRSPVERQLHKEYQEYNRASFTLGILSKYIYVHLGLVLYDRFFFEHDNPFTEWRWVYLSLLVPCFLSLRFFLKTSSERQLLDPRFITRFGTVSLCSFVLTAATLAFYFQYFYFSVITSQSDELQVVVGTCLLLIVATYSLHSYRTEVLVISGISIITAIVLLYLFPERTAALSLVLTFSIVSLIPASINEGRFVRGLSTKYETLARHLPPRFAWEVAVTDDPKAAERKFPPENRFVACVSSDWRDSQKLFETLTPLEISNLQKQYYGKVLEVLERECPEGDYYFDWTADAMFIIFFSIQDDRDQVRENSLKVVGALANEVADWVTKDLNGTIRFDVGVACGVGLLGIFGPEKMRKPTVNSKIAGHAKRFEQEAAAIRKSSTSSYHSMPTCVFGEGYSSDQIAKYLDEQFLDSTHLPKMKDISGASIIVWRPLGFRHLKAVS